jgi:hypothetical protein
MKKMINAENKSWEKACNVSDTKENKSKKENYTFSI